MTVAFMTLGCKVNQYDSQAILEGFLARGYRHGDFSQICDVYVINTCVVTGVGEQKSRKAIRQAARRNPDAAIVVAGCLSQREGEGLLALPGVRLVLGNARRAQAAQLLEDALARGVSLCAVGELGEEPFEETPVTAREGFTRAVLKIQEGCENRCAYCTIPDARGPSRSRSLRSIREEAERLGEAGYREAVVTGIHLCSYAGEEGATLLDALDAVHTAPGIRRVRLGSLEPSFITAQAAQRLAGLDKLCQQFHLSLQSGSGKILRLMRRRYAPGDFAAAVARLREAMPGCAITTDVITGFPGEGGEEFLETMDFAREMNFARMHVFPYSQREGTPAATFPDQVPMALRRERAQRLIALGEEMEAAYVAGQIGQVREVLFEQEGRGLTREYVEVEAEGGVPGEIVPVRITHSQGNLAFGHICEEDK